MRVNTLGLEVRDDAFDEIADTVDGRVVSPVAVCEFTMSGFPGRGDHPQSDVALVTNMPRGIKCLEEAGFRDGLRIVECDSLCMSHLSMIYYLRLRSSRETNPCPS